MFRRWLLRTRNQPRSRAARRTVRYQLATDPPCLLRLLRLYAGPVLAGSYNGPGQERPIPLPLGTHRLDVPALRNDYTTTFVPSFVVRMSQLAEDTPGRGSSHAEGATSGSLVGCGLRSGGAPVVDSPRVASLRMDIELVTAIWRNHGRRAHRSPCEQPARGLLTEAEKNLLHRISVEQGQGNAVDVSSESGFGLPTIRRNRARLIDRARELRAVDAALSSAHRGRRQRDDRRGRSRVSGRRPCSTSLPRAFGGVGLSRSARHRDATRAWAFPSVSRSNCWNVTGSRPTKPSARRSVPDLRTSPVRSWRGAWRRSRSRREQVYRVIRGLFWLMRNLLSVRAADEGRPAVTVLVDDAQWADDESLRFLAYLAARQRHLPIALIVAMRRAEPDEAAPLSEFRHSGDAVTLRPGPLSTDGVGAAVRERFPDADETFVAACAEATGGSPFLLDGGARRRFAAAGTPTVRHGSPSSCRRRCDAVSSELRVDVATTSKR